MQAFTRTTICCQLCKLDRFTARGTSIVTRRGSDPCDCKLNGLPGLQQFLADIGLNLAGHLGNQAASERSFCRVSCNFIRT